MWQSIALVMYMEYIRDVGRVPDISPIIFHHYASVPPPCHPRGHAWPYSTMGLRFKTVPFAYRML